MEIRELFLECVSASLAGRRPNAPADCDWDALLKLCCEQKLTVVVYSAIFPIVGKQGVWRSAAMRDVVYQTQSNEEFLKLYRELAAHGLQPLVVKGILCRETYPEPDARISSDEDLYVPRAEYRRFHQVMQELGFRTEEPDLDNAHELRYTRNGLLVEGHWELFPQDHGVLNALNALNEGFWSRSGVQTVSGVPMRVLEPTDHMTFLLLHLFKHFINSGAGVRQICDVAQWAKAYPMDWARVRSALRSAHAERFAGAVFDAGEKYFGMDYPEGWPRADCAALLEDAISGGVYGTISMTRKHSGNMTLAAVDDAENANRLRSLLRTVFPNRSVMEMSYRWVKKSALLLPAAWVLRIVKYLGKLDKNNAAGASLKIGSERMELLKHYQIL